MATSVVPALIDALVSACAAALPNVSVVDGMTISHEPGTYLQIGVSDPDAETFTESADATQSVANMGSSRSRDERGTVACVVEAWDGGSNMKAARDAAYAVTAAVENVIRNRGVPALGVPGLLDLTYAPDIQVLSQGQFTTGAVARVLFFVGFRARI